MTFSPTGQFLNARNSFLKEYPYYNIITNYLEYFVEMVRTTPSRFKGRESDITYWISEGWATFRTFIENQYEMKWISGKERKRLTKIQNSIRLPDTHRFTIVIPLNHDASRLYGAGTRWCTSGRESDSFDKYFHKNNGILMLLLPKDESQEKYACLWSNGELSEMFNEKSETIHSKNTTTEVFQPLVGLPSELFYEMFVKPHLKKIRDLQTNKIVHLKVGPSAIDNSDFYFEEMRRAMAVPGHLMYGDGEPVANILADMQRAMNEYQISSIRQLESLVGLSRTLGMERGQFNVIYQVPRRIGHINLRVVIDRSLSISGDLGEA